MLRWISASRWAAALLVTAAAPAFASAADDDFQTPVTSAIAQSEAAAERGPADDASRQAAAAERWALRSQQLKQSAQQAQSAPEANWNGQADPRVRGSRQFATAVPSYSDGPPRVAYRSNNQPAPLSVRQIPEIQPPRPEVVTRPSQLKRITQILPFRDYEPDPKIAHDDPCLNLCPRPDGAPCRVAPGTRVPECPRELVLSEGPYQSRMLPPSLFTWEASNIHYNPLYFEDAPLERYGHTWPCLMQPFVSVGKFTGQLFFLPYQMTIDPPCSCVYPLGFYRPGECAPKKCYQPPLNAHAALVQAGAVAGAVAIFP